ncbi:hypothetical protein AM391_RS21305 [Kluyvera ascorbata]|nr:hypothetical protein [Kluyvera ascorbata]
MILTHDDVKNDIRKVMDKLGSGSLKIANPLQAFKLSALYTLPCTILHALTTLYIYMVISSSATVIYGFLIILLCSMLLTVIQYSNALMYLSIPDDVRRESIIIKKVKKTYLRVVSFTVIVNAVAALVFFITKHYLIAIPVCFIVGFIINQVTLSAEISRYGIGVLIEKATGLMKKI